MVQKVRVFENNVEKLVPFSAIVGSVTRGRERIDITTVVANTVTLPNVPQPLSETVFVNGLAMTDGATCDYTIVGNTITFNSGVLTQTGNILINYSY